MSETNFIFVGCILLRNVHDKNLSDIYLQSQLRFFYIDVIISPCITTCFGPYGPSSGEYNILFLFLNHVRESHRYHNGSVVHKFVSYYIEGKYELFTMDYLSTFSVISLI
jgi:hypothetical protein